MKKMGQIAKTRGAVAESVRLLEQGNLEKASQTIQSVLKQASEFPEALGVMGRIFLAKGDLRTAANVLADAHRLDMENDFLAAIYGGVCNSLGRSEYALSLVNGRIDSSTTDVNLLFTRANAYELMSEFEAAYQDFLRVTKLAPGVFQYWNGLAHCCDELGLQDEKERALEKAVLTGETRPIGILRLLRAKKENLTTDPEKMAREFLANKSNAASPNRYVETLIELELAKTRLERKSAFDRLVVAGNLRLKSNEDRLNRSKEQRQDVLKTLKRSKSLNPPKPPQEFPTSVFILGPSRSGKTTVERLLNRHGNLKNWHECQKIKQAKRKVLASNNHPLTASLSEMSKKDLGAVRARYLELMTASPEASVFTYTNPTNIYMAEVLYGFLPNTKFILVSRDDEDTVMRQFTYYYPKGNVHAFNLDATRDYVRWYREMQSELIRLCGRNAYMVSYEELVEDTQSVMEGVENFLGLPGGVDYPNLPDDRGYAAQFRDLL